MATGVNRRTEWTSALVVRAALVASWVALCDLWLKAVARTGACPSVAGLPDVAARPWTLPDGCGTVSVFGDAVTLAPVVRDGGALGILGSGMVWAVIIVVVAIAVTVLIVRWPYRDPGDALGLGGLWGGAGVLVVPHLLGLGGFAELGVVGLPIAIGDIALAWALLWFGWRAIAEARA